MFDPSFDPLAELQRIQQDSVQLRNNQMQLAKAFNEQGQTIQELVKVINNMHQEIIILNDRLQLLEMARQYDEKN